MSRSSHLVIALGLIWGGTALAQDPATTGGATRSTMTASQNATGIPAPASYIVGGAAIIGTIVGLSSDGNGENSTSTSTSTATATAAP